VSPAVGVALGSAAVIALSGSDAQLNTTVLQHNLATFGMHSVGDLLPASRLFGAPDTGGCSVATA